jgi:diguanylate cyclase (GGDEF)-like protein
MCGVIIWKEYQGLTHTARRATTFHDMLAVRSLSQWISAHKKELHSLAVLPEIQQVQPETTAQVLQTHAKISPDVNMLAVVEPSGKITAASTEVKKGTTLKNLAVLQKTVQTAQFNTSGYVACPLTQEPAILFAHPVIDSRSQQLKSVLIASVHPGAILQLFSGLGEEQGSVIAVVDQDKKVLARTLDNEKWLGRDFSNAKTVTAASKTRSGNIEVVGIADGTQRTYAFDRVPETNWIVVAGIPTHIIYGSAHDRLFLMLFSAALAIGSSVLLAYAVTGHFTGPIHELVREAVAVGRGELTKRVNLNQGGELGLLARAFNNMALNLQLHEEHSLMIEKIAESVRQSLDLDEILNTAVLELGKALGASRCCLALVEDVQPVVVDGQAEPHLEFNYVWWDPVRQGTALQNRSIVVTERSILKSILEQKAILSLDVMDQSSFAPMFEREEASPEDWRSVKTLIACPIVLDHQPVGMILVHQCDRRRAWLDLELQLVEAVARHVSLAMEHANLFAHTKRLAEQEFLINRIVRATRSSLDTDEILNTVTRELGRALSADYCQIAQPRPEGPLVITHEFVREGLESRKGLGLYGTRMDFDPSDEGKAELRTVLGIDLGSLKEIDSSAQEAPIAAITNVSEDKRAEQFSEFLNVVGSRSVVAAPLLQDDRVLGILILHQCDRIREWDSGDVHLVSVVADQLAVAISHAQLFSQVKYQAITDGLTGLYNHVYFKNRLAEELNRANRKSKTCSLLMLDLDKLKQINDTFGHPVGDAAIRQVATMLKTLLRSGDTAARYGGEEFAVILPETPMPEAVMIADRLRRNINRTPVPGLGHISTSIGVASFPSQAVSGEELIDKADKALYVAKRGGRNRVCVWDEVQPVTVAADDPMPPPSLPAANGTTTVTPAEDEAPRVQG